MTPALTSMAVMTEGPRTTAQNRDEQRLRAARAALQTYDQQRTDAADERKAIARKKAEDLKARIQMMKMSMPSDPQAAARVIAALARELGAAVKAYGGAGGGLEVGLTAASAPVADASVADVSAPDTAAPEAVAPGAEAPTGDGEAAPTDPYRQAQQAHDARAAEQARKSEGARADSEFAATVKGLMAELKAMARKAERDARAQGDAPPDDLAAVDRSMSGIEGDLNAAGGALSGALMSLTV